MRRKRGLNLSLLVGEAAALADEQGLGSLTLANLAERLNVRPPSLYNHIASADDLEHQLALFALQALGDEVARAAIGRNGSTGLVAVANAYRDFAKTHPGMYSATLRAARPDDPAMQNVAKAMLDVLRAVLAPFHLDEDGTVNAIRGFRSLVHGFVSLEAAHGFGLGQDIDESFRSAVGLFVRGVKDAQSAVPSENLVEPARRRASPLP